MAWLVCANEINNENEEASACPIGGRHQREGHHGNRGPDGNSSGEANSQSAIISTFRAIFVSHSGRLSSLAGTGTAADNNNNNNEEDVYEAGPKQTIIAGPALASSVPRSLKLCVLYVVVVAIDDWRLSSKTRADSSTGGGPFSHGARQLVCCKRMSERGQPGARALSARQIKRIVTRCPRPSLYC